MKLEIKQYPHPSLTAVSEEVVAPINREDRDLAITMLKMVKEDKGSAGLAAPQVGVNKRVCIVSDNGKKPMVMINPVVTHQGVKRSVGVEGCLSLEGLWEIERANVIKVKYLDIKGSPKILTAKNWFARVILHEIDHLDGVLINQIGTKHNPKKD